MQNLLLISRIILFLQREVNNLHQSIVKERDVWTTARGAILADSSGDEDIYQKGVNKGKLDCIAEKITLNERWMIRSKYAFKYFNVDTSLPSEASAVSHDLSNSPDLEEEAVFLIGEGEDEVNNAVESEGEGEEEDLEQDPEAVQ